MVVTICVAVDHLPVAGPAQRLFDKEFHRAGGAKPLPRFLWTTLAFKGNRQLWHGVNIQLEYNHLLDWDMVDLHTLCGFRDAE